MNKVTKAELARRFGVNQSRINALLNGENPKLIETDDGFIDLDDAHNRAYIKTREITVPKYTGIGFEDNEDDYVSINNNYAQHNEKDKKKHRAKKT